MRISYSLLSLLLIIQICKVSAQTIPNSGLETWINHGQYEDPQYWDTPNQEVCFLPFYTKVVTKSTSSQSGSFSAKLETKTIPIVNVTVPGVITLGTLVIDIGNMSFTIEGGAPIADRPTHLKGYFKFQPKGGDSCVIAIGLTKWKNGGRDTIGGGIFSSHDTITSWTPFSLWIEYIDSGNPDTMNIAAISSATYTPTAGTLLYVDDLALDYTTTVNEKDPGNGIDIYQDNEQKELLVFLNFPSPQSTSFRLMNIMGKEIMKIQPQSIVNKQVKIAYNNLDPGLYILEIIHGNQRYLKKFLLNSN
jgi:hypothetical protein